MSYPIRIDGRFVGAASANITMSVLSGFLDKHRASPNSITLIADRDGNVIAHPIAARGMWRSRERIALATLSKLEEPQVVKAVQMRKVLGTDRSASPWRRRQGIRCPVCSLSRRLRQALGSCCVTPTDDFVGALEQTNRRLIWLMVFLVLPRECVDLRHGAEDRAAHRDRV